MPIPKVCFTCHKMLEMSSNGKKSSQTAASEDFMCECTRERVCVTEGGSKNKQARDAMASSNTM